MYVQNYLRSLDGRRSYVIITRFKCQQAKITLLGPTTPTTSLDPNWDVEISFDFSVPRCVPPVPNATGRLQKKTLKSIHPFIHSFNSDTSDMLEENIV